MLFELNYGALVRANTVLEMMDFYFEFDGRICQYSFSVGVLTVSAVAYVGFH